MNDGSRRKNQLKINPARRVRIPLVLAGLAALLFAMLVGLWGLSRAADRRSVWQVSRPILAGEVVTADALIPVGVATDRDSGLIAVTDTTKVGLVASHDLAKGDLLNASDVTARPTLLPGEQAVGAVLRPGKMPSDLRRGDTVLVAELAPTPGAPPSPPVKARIVDIANVSTAAQVSGSPGIRQGIDVVLAVPSPSAVTVALWAGADRLVVVRDVRS